MTTQIHELRNRLTTAVLTATAMLDGKLPTDKSNLQGLVRALEDVKSIVATVSKYDWDQTPAGDQVVDVEDLVRSVVDELAVVSSAGDVRLVVIGSDPRMKSCGVLRGHALDLHEAVEGAVHALVSALPPRSSIRVAAGPGAVVRLTTTIPVDWQLAAAHLSAIAPALESRGGRVHLGAQPGEYCLHLPGRPICGEPAATHEQVGSAAHK
jgi:hypothetical protein